MKIQCDVCEKQQAAVFCAADEAALCDGCDRRVHHANKLANRHPRFSLLHPSSIKESPQCDICQERRAFLFCREDRSILCRECDVSVHSANEHTRKHNRFLLSGVKLSSSSAVYQACSSSSSEHRSANLEAEINSSEPSDSVGGGIGVPNWISNSTPSPSQNYRQISEEGSISTATTSAVPEFLMDMPLTGWHFDDFVDYSSTAAQSYYF